MDSEIEEWNRAIEDKLDSSGYRTIGIVSRIAGTLSVLGAGYIIQDIVKNAALRRATKNRIIMVMSVCDFLNQFLNSVLGPVMVPKGIGVPGAVGNQSTCDIQGFLTYASGTASGLYNVSLAICYLLIVRYRYTHEQLRKLEPYFLYPPTIMCLLMAIAGLPFQIYNFASSTDFTCFLGASPTDCDNIDSPVECERGTMYIYWHYFNAVAILLSASAISFCMIRIYSAVLEHDRSADWFRFPPSSSSTASANINGLRSSADPSRELSNTIRSQGLWYSGAFLFTFSPLMLFFILKIDAILALSLLTFNLIGFTNAVIYIRPRFLKFRRDYPDTGIGSSIWHTIARTRPFPGRTNSRSVTLCSFWVSLGPFLSRMKSIMTIRSSIDTPSGVQNETGLVTVEEEGIARPKKNKGEQSFLIVEHSECNQEQVIVVDEGGFEKDCQYSVDQEEDGDLEDIVATNTDITGIQRLKDENDTSSANPKSKFRFEKKNSDGEMEVGSGNGLSQEL